jgi:hypothetical protein
MKKVFEILRDFLDKRMGWDQIYRHEIFENYFSDYLKKTKEIEVIKKLTKRQLE